MAIYSIIPTDWSKVFPKAKQMVIEHGPQILTGVGLSAMVGAGIIAVKNTPAAYEAINDKKEEEGVRKLPLIDIIKVGWKYYVVPVGMAIAGSTCIVSAIKVSTDRADAFAALAASQAMRYKDYRDVTKEKVGPKKAQEIDTEMARRDIESKYPPDIREIEESGHGDQIIWWPTMGRWFKCDIGWIRRVQNEINKEIRDGDVNEIDPYDTKTLSGVCLNRFLAGVGISKADLGLLLGWNGKNLLNIKFSDMVTGKESEKAVVLEMHMDDCMPMPKWDTVRQDRPQYLAPF